MKKTGFILGTQYFRPPFPKSRYWADDIKAIAIPVLAHRVILSGESQLSRRSAADVLSDLLDRTRVPAQPR